MTASLLLAYLQDKLGGYFHAIQLINSCELQLFLVCSRVNRSLLKSSPAPYVSYTPEIEGICYNWEEKKMMHSAA